MKNVCGACLAEDENTSDSERLSFHSVDLNYVKISEEKHLIIKYFVVLYPNNMCVKFNKIS